jgi:signal transduction histidine kinase
MGMESKFPRYLGSLSRRSLVMLGLTLTVLLGAADYLTGPELSFSIFYLIPVCLVAWFVGWRPGVMMSVLGAAVWLTSDLAAGHFYSHPAIALWNAMVRLGLFVTTSALAFAVSALRVSHERQEDLVRFIAHDLRSPLGIVIGGLQALKESGGETMDTAQRDLVETSIVSGNRILMLVNSLLDVARLESGQMPLQLSQVDVHNLVASSLKHVEWWMQEQHIAFVLRQDPGVTSVYADQAVTERILVNLLSNAIQFSPRESTIAIHVASLNGSTVVFSVTDQGYGIPKEWIGRVFDKFAQVEAHKAGDRIGTGLGLTFCRLAVEAQGGRIWLKSAADSGTTVTFALPVKARSSSPG